MENILENIAVIKNRIAAACQRAHRNPEEVKLLLATKTVTPERIKVALRAGNTLIAESAGAQRKI